MSAAVVRPAPQAIPTARFLPVTSDANAPTLKLGDFLAVIPVGSFRCCGFYVLDSGLGFDMWRCSAELSGKVRMSRDNPLYPGVVLLSPAEFSERVLGQVFAICNVIDASAMEAMRRADA